MVGATKSDGLGGSSPAVITWSGQMNPQNGTPSPSSPLHRRLSRLDVLEVFTSIFVSTMADPEYLIFDEKEAF